jgi:hypothetical protein
MATHLMDGASHTVQAKVDNTNRVDELHENNNDLVRTMRFDFNYARTAACSPKPANSVWNTASTIRQIYHPSYGYTPPNTSSYSTIAQPPLCRYKCAAGYIYRSGACEPEVTCDYSWVRDTSWGNCNNVGKQYLGSHCENQSGQIVSDSYCSCAGTEPPLQENNCTYQCAYNQLYWFGMQGRNVYKQICSNGCPNGATECAPPPKNCTVNGITVFHRQAYRFYDAPSSPTCYNYYRTCNDGVLSGDPSHIYPECTLRQICVPNQIGGYVSTSAGTFGYCYNTRWQCNPFGTDWRFYSQLSSGCCTDCKSVSGCRYCN